MNSSAAASCPETESQLQVVSVLLGVVAFPQLVLVAYYMLRWCHKSAVFTINSPKAPRRPSLNILKRRSSLKVKQKRSLSSSFMGGRGAAVSDGDAGATDYQWEIKFKEIKIGKEIGRGNYGTVVEGTWVGLPVAIKRPHAAHIRDDPKAMDGFLYEIEMMTKLHHPNIVQFLGACITSPNICLVLEYLPLGNLHDLVRRESEQFSTAKIHKCAVDIARGMCYLHRRCRLIQRDLKTRNILVDE